MFGAKFLVTHKVPEQSILSKDRALHKRVSKTLPPLFSEVGLYDSMAAFQSRAVVAVGWDLGDGARA